ncbi:unnamed protein product [Polarella glacialis]|uniref:Uncharacterized protein n=1 Tax=Polarella glacialis TaxID=89957 RepID=A0A813EH24_POLGL|nr:unnamed protein product [Polarella glacialis]
MWAQELDSTFAVPSASPPGFALPSPCARAQANDGRRIPLTHDPSWAIRWADELSLRAIPLLGRGRPADKNNRALKPASVDAFPPWAVQWADELNLALIGGRPCKPDAVMPDVGHGQPRPPVAAVPAQLGPPGGPAWAGNVSMPPGMPGLPSWLARSFQTMADQSLTAPAIIRRTLKPMPDGQAPSLEQVLALCWKAGFYTDAAQLVPLYAQSGSKGPLVGVTVRLAAGGGAAAFYVKQGKVVISGRNPQVRATILGFVKDFTEDLPNMKAGHVFPTPEQFAQMLSRDPAE